MNYKIVVYSWTGNTTACAVALQQIMDIEAFLLLEEKERKGNSGFALGGTQASLGLKTKLKEMPDLTHTEVLILGMPVWAGRTPPIINTFFSECDLSGKTVYTFCTQMSDGVPHKLEELLKKQIEKKGGKFAHLFVLQVSRGTQLNVEKAKERVENWAVHIKSGE